MKYLVQMRLANPSPASPQVESIQELDDLIMGLPVWPRMETTVTALTSFDGRMASVRARMDHLKAQTRNDAGRSV